LSSRDHRPSGWRNEFERFKGKRAGKRGSALHPVFPHRIRLAANCSKRKSL
jgi:hypothetical protein